MVGLMRIGFGLVFAVVCFPGCGDESNGSASEATSDTQETIQANESEANPASTTTVYYLNKSGIFDFKNQDSNAPTLHQSYYAVEFAGEEQITSWKKYEKPSEASPPPGKVREAEIYHYYPSGKLRKRDVLNSPFKWVRKEFLYFPDGETPKEINVYRSPQLLQQKQEFHEDGFMHRQTTVQADGNYRVELMGSETHPIANDAYQLQSYNRNNQKHGVWKRYHNAEPPCNYPINEENWKNGKLVQFAKMHFEQGYPVEWNVYQLKSDIYTDNEIEDMSNWKRIYSIPWNTDCPQ